MHGNDQYNLQLREHPLNWRGIGKYEVIHLHIAEVLEECHNHDYSIASFLKLSVICIFIQL